MQSSQKAPVKSQFFKLLLGNLSLAPLVMQAGAKHANFHHPQSAQLPFELSRLQASWSPAAQSSWDGKGLQGVRPCLAYQTGFQPFQIGIPGARWNFGLAARLNTGLMVRHSTFIRPLGMQFSFQVSKAIPGVPGLSVSTPTQGLQYHFQISLGQKRAHRKTWKAPVNRGMANSQSVSIVEQLNPAPNECEEPAASEQTEELSKLLEPYTGENGQPLPIGYDQKIVEILKPYIGKGGGHDKLLLMALEPYTGKNGQPLPDEFVKKIIAAPNNIASSETLRHSLKRFEKQALRKLLVPYSGKNGQPLPIGVDQKIVEILKPYLGGIENARWLRRALESYTGENGEPLSIGFDRKVDNGRSLPIELFGAMMSLLEPTGEVESAKWIRRGLLSCTSEDGELFPIELCEPIIAFLELEDFFGPVYELKNCLRTVARDNLSKLLEPYIGENGQPLPTGFSQKIVKVLKPYIGEPLYGTGDWICGPLESYAGENGRSLPIELFGAMMSLLEPTGKVENAKWIRRWLLAKTGEGGKQLTRKLFETIFSFLELEDSDLGAYRQCKKLRELLGRGAKANLSKLLKPYTGENAQRLPIGFDQKIVEILKPCLGEEGVYDKWFHPGEKGVYDKWFHPGEKGVYDQLLLRELGLHTGEDGEPLPDKLAELIIAAPVSNCAYYLKFYLEGVEEKKKLSVLLGPYAGGNAQPLPTGFNQKIVEVLKPRICKDMWDKLLLEGLELYTGENGQPLPKELAEAILSAPQDSFNYGINLERCLRKVTQETLSTLLEPYTGKNGQALPSEFGYKLFKILNPYIVCLEDLDELILRALEPYTGENGQPLSEEVAKKIIEGPKERNDDTVFYLIKCRNKENRSERYTR